VDRHVGVFAVIEAGAPQPGVIEIETERFDEVEVIAGVDRESHQVAGVGRNLRPVEDHVERGAHSVALADFSISKMNARAGSFD
jgi:hypothetical protein